jgi:hypothetical protein
MSAGYYIDLKSVTLRGYEKELEETVLLPGRRMLQNDTGENFRRLEKNGIKNLQEILDALKTPEKIRSFSGRTGISTEYLTILKREIAGNLPKPVKLADFPGISKAAIKKLSLLTLNDTKQLFEFVITEYNRKDMCEKTGITYDVMLELTKLTDVSRIKWVGANFARLLVDSSEDTAKKVSKADYTKLYDAVIRINEEKKYFKGKFGLNDMKLCVLAAKNVPDVIKF